MCPSPKCGCPPRTPRLTLTPLRALVPPGEPCPPHAMSRRSQRLVTSRYYPGDEDAASSSSLLGGHQTPFKETTGRYGADRQTDGRMDSGGAGAVLHPACPLPAASGWLAGGEARCERAAPENRSGASGNGAGGSPPRGWWQRVSQAEVALSSPPRPCIRCCVVPTSPFSPPPSRTVRRKSSSTKRLSPAPSTQTSYYSESMMSESYLGGSRGLAALGTSGLDDPLDRSIYWGEPVLSHQPRCWGAPSWFLGWLDSWGAPWG